MIAIVGGGIAGLAAARTLADAGRDVIVLESRDRLGGQVLTRQLSGWSLDLGAEALHANGRPPEPLGQLGLAPVSARRAPTWLATERGLVALPDGVGPAGPSRLGPVARSGILSWRGLLRAAVEPLVTGPRPTDDVAVGAFLSRRFGSEVVDRLVDPLVGGLHAGDVQRLGLAAATPRLDALARRHRSLLLAPRPRAHDSGLVTVDGGLGRIVVKLADHRRIDARTSTPVQRIRTDGSRCVIDEDLRVDGVVVATGPHHAARLLDDLDPDRSLAGIRTATVAVAIVTYPRVHVEGLPAFTGTGLLVGSRSGLLLKSATLLGRKWPHLAQDASFPVRLSAGRADDRRTFDLDDAELVAALHHDLARLTGVDVPPTLLAVERWTDAMPQLEVGHTARVAATRSRLAGQPIELAGAAIDGVGITTAARSGRHAAQRLLERVGS